MPKETYIPKIEVDRIIDGLYKKLFEKNQNLIYLASVPLNETNPDPNEYYIENGVSSKNGLMISKIPVIKGTDGKYTVPKIFYDRINSQIPYIKNPIDENSETPSKDVIVNPFSLQGCNNMLRCIKSGMNIGHHNSAHLGGTIGGFFRIEESDSIYMISNFHVLSGRVRVRNRLICQPSENLSGGFRIKNIIGVFRYGIFKDYVDVGFAKVLAKDIVSSGTNLGLPSPKGLYNGLDYKLDGKSVYLVGSNSGLRKGHIRSTNSYVRFKRHPNDLNYHIFKKQLLLPNMSTGGDSGSLIILKETKEAIGLLFGGDSINYSVANNLKFIFKNIPETNDELKKITFKNFY